MLQTLISLKTLFVVIIIGASLFVRGQIPSGYYDNAAGLSGDALKTALHDIIDNHTELSYTAVENALKDTDEDPDNSNNVICFYTGWSYAKSNFGNGVSQWNREHTWSKSHGDFGESPPEGTDLHHMKPTDVTVNSQKGNRDFDDGGIPYTDNDGPTGCYYTANSWEPIDAVKGDVARIIFYMETRYEGGVSELDLEMVDYVNSAPNGEAFYGKKSTLLFWHQNDPVDAFEVNRNNVIYADYQGNRNPFIDHPEYVNLIWGGGVIAEPSNHVATFVAGPPSATTIPLTWNDNDGAVAAHGYLIKANTTNTFTPPADETPETDDTDMSDGEGQMNVGRATEAYTWQNLDVGTTYYFAIYPFTNSGTDIDYKTDGTIPTANATTALVSSGLIISEVADPDDDYKGRFVEIYNASGSAIDLGGDDWYLCRQANAGSWGDAQLTGTLAAGGVFTVASNTTDFNNAYGFNPDMSNANISGNGNDGYFLYTGGDHSTGQLIDAYGVIDEDGNGKAWEYENSKAVRKRNITAPSENWMASEWVISAADVQDMTPSACKEDVNWQGSSSTDFNERGINWSGTQGFVPDASYNVMVPDVANKPVVTKVSVINSISIQASSSVEVSSGATLTVLE